MNKKNIVLLGGILIIILMVAGCGYLFFKYKSSILAKKDVNFEQKAVVEDKKINEKTGQFDVQITYPYISGNDEFNKLSENIVNKELNDFKTTSLENDNAVKEIDPESYALFPRQYSLYIGYDKGDTENKDIVSIVFNISNFTGGAHGANYFIPLNFDLKNKKEITLSDLFSGQNNYLQKISDYCIENLTKQVKERAESDNIDSAWIKDGAGANEENFFVFRIDKNTITFYFPQYQVAAYALGDFKVTMPK